MQHEPEFDICVSFWSKIEWKPFDSGNRNIKLRYGRRKSNAPRSNGLINVSNNNHFVCLVSISLYSKCFFILIKLISS